MRWTLLIFSLVIMASCGEFDSPEEQKAEDSPKREQSTLSQQQKTFSIAPQIARILDTPYKVAICYAVLDTPDYDRLSQYFTESLHDVIDRTFAYKLFNDNDYVQLVLYAKSTREIGSEFFRSVRGNELAIAIEICVADEYLRMRRIDLRTGELSLAKKFPLRYGTEAADVTARHLLEFVGIEGYIAKQDEQQLEIVFRGDPQILPIEQLKQSSLWIFRGKQRVTGSFVQVDKAFIRPPHLVAVGKVLGDYSPVGTERLAPVSFTGGRQMIKLVDGRGIGLQGYSIYANYEKFDDSAASYRGTTDSNGQFLLSDSQKKPIYLTVAKNIEGVNFTFVEKRIVVENQAPLLKIAIETFDELAVAAKGEIKKAQSKVVSRLQQAKDYISRGELAKAQLAMRYAKALLRQFDRAEAPQLYDTLANLDRMYQSVTTREDARRKRLDAFAWIEKADAEVEKLAYEKAQEMLKKAKAGWPQNMDPEGYQGILKRLDRLNLLIIDEYTPLGEARKFLSLRLSTLSKDNISSQTIDELERHIIVLLKNGELAKDEIYSDYQMLLRIRISLNTLSAHLASLAERYLQEYKHATTLVQRQKIYERHTQYFHLSKRLDSILQKLEK